MAPRIAPLPIIDLADGCQIVLEAIDPTTGNQVAGVAITDATVYAVDLEGALGDAPLETMYLLPTGG